MVTLKLTNHEHALLCEMLEMSTGHQSDCSAVKSENWGCDCDGHGEYAAANPTPNDNAKDALFQKIWNARKPR